jgi:xanthosine utilization system XapX-like protein
MNSNSQLDFHPDAESLNAFAEQALGAAEREQVLSHLAGCSRCRQVVYLAQAAAEAEIPAAVAVSRATAEDRPWFANWRWTWVPAAALAAVAALAVTFYPWASGFRPKQTPVAPEVAKVVPQNAMQVPKPTFQKHRNAETARPAVPPVTLKPSAKSVQPAARPTLPVETGQLQLAPSAGPEAAGSVHGESYAPLSLPSASGPSATGLGVTGTNIGGQANAVLFKPQPAANSWPQQTLQKRMAGGPARTAATTQVAQTNLRAMGGPQAARTLNFAAAMPRSEAQPASGTSLEVSMKRLPAAVPVLAGLGGFKLSNGAMAVSAAVTLHQTLALDGTGALFLSEDGGLHWEPVAQQWTGRAIEVRTTRAASGPAAPPVTFELMNEAGLTWVSADGKAWKAK